MNRPSFWATVSLLILVTTAVADVWTEAEKAITRLDPSTFAILPKRIVQALRDRQCVVPQAYLPTKPHNVITGSFAKEGQIDWAVLCSTNGVSSINIFWGGSAQCASKIEENEDRAYLEGISVDKAGYTRSISAVSKAQILESREMSHAGGKLPPISHAGIDDGSEKGSTIHFCHKGEWLQLAGGD